jgi:hypothetical protein
MTPGLAWRPRGRRPGRFQGVVPVVLFVLIALVCGLAIAVLPPQFAIAVSGFFVIVVALSVAAVAPPMEAIPARALAWGLLIALVFYFVWPRNVFLPIRVLPIKHPQRLFYLLFLAYAGYVALKCAPARQLLARGFGAVPWLTGLWLTLAVWQFTSLVTAERPLALTGAWFVDLLVDTLLYPLAILCCPTLKDIRRLLAALLIAALVNCLMAIPETLLQHNLFERFITLDIVDSEVANQLTASKVRGGNYRAQASFDHPLLFAEFVVINLPFAIALLLQRGRRVLGGLALGLLFVGLYTSHSRIALVAGAAAVAAMVVALIVRGAQTGRKNPWPLVVTFFALPVLIAGAIVVGLLLQQAAVGRTQVEASSTAARLQMLYGGWRLIQEQPLLGYGPTMGALTLNFRNTFGVITLDNYFLSLALDSGLPALALFLLMLSVASWQYLKLAVTAQDRNVHVAAWVSFGALLAFIPIKAVLGTPLNNLMIFVWLGGLAALLHHAPNPLAMNRTH